MSRRCRSDGVSRGCADVSKYAPRTADVHWPLPRNCLISPSLSPAANVPERRISRGRSGGGLVVIAQASAWPRRAAIDAGRLWTESGHGNKSAGPVGAVLVQRRGTATTPTSIDPHQATGKIQPRRQSAAPPAEPKTPAAPPDPETPEGPAATNRSGALAASLSGPAGPRQLT